MIDPFLQFKILCYVIGITGYLILGTLTGYWSTGLLREIREEIRG